MSLLMQGSCYSSSFLVISLVISPKKKDQKRLSYLLYLTEKIIYSHDSPIATSYTLNYSILLSRRGITRTGNEKIT
ncbi:uncharacterized protein SPAPADRAFT_62961 [Spathaspora passalidarum NRRL Y-27907]|uniref:Uncharacterized protein n=1 Tax=Spathaspora passalidarum (strain NRRL Y-27907 / 11-Y1) TaxID=619300 RepID=G3ASE2_SPAPN|nr:uncharacterized protein SPAPADRAFT_62961 [Spathaspora passalidarum NRRL Y-27907]EGW31060.1 hypothetical protein SPAPADRAFT_62961 [Spathaspora passalidarum NRRL Y-27907]